MSEQMVPRSVAERLAVDGFRRGWDEALDAARESVEREWTEDPSWDGTNWNNALSCATEAIDALREEQK